MHTPMHFPVRHVHNAEADPARPWGPAEDAVLDEDGFRAAPDECTAWSAHAPTPPVPRAQTFGVNCVVRIGPDGATDGATDEDACRRVFGRPAGEVEPARPITPIPEPRHVG